MNVGDIPMVNGFTSDAHAAVNSTRFPADWLICSNCDLVQLGFQVKRQIIFPQNYSYTSGATQLKLENFRDPFNESQSLVNLTPSL